MGRNRGRMEKVGFSMRWLLSFLVFVVGSLFGTSQGQTPLPCGRDTIALQTYYMQDISYSFTDKLQNLVDNVMTPVVNTLSSEFAETRWALASFSDKPSFPSGFSSDHCYREEQVFTTDDQAFLQQLDSLTILSGLDWKESQMDSIAYGVNSADIGWDFRENTDDGRWIMRVVMVGTDAGPHLEGDMPFLVGGTDCTGLDYPSLSAVKQLLESRRVYPVFVVPLNLKRYWDILLTSWPNVRVVESSDTYVLPAIYEIADEFCATTTAAPTATAPVPSAAGAGAAPTTTTAAPTAAAALGCGNSLVVQPGLPFLTCEQQCFSNGDICHEKNTSRVNTSREDCRQAIGEFVGINTFPIVTQPKEPTLAVGCNFRFEPTAEIVIVTDTPGSEIGCNAAPATEQGFPSRRVCCCN